MPPLRIALASLATGLACLALATLLAPQTAPIVMMPAAIPPATITAPPVDTTRLIAIIAARPLFRPDRRPVAAVIQGDADLPRLSGILFGPQVAVAIFTPGSGATRLVTKGERIGAYRLSAITADTVTLTGPGVTLRLTPRFAGSNAAPPPASQTPALQTPLFQMPGRH
ncbi:hypothetical protein [Acidiphilium sp.]|uniref:hypothetical protein n=1 Tax=Acidiphilium sp. TaxID=527 RepID=UPI003D04B517